MESASNRSRDEAGLSVEPDELIVSILTDLSGLPQLVSSSNSNLLSGSNQSLGSNLPIISRPPLPSPYFVPREFNPANPTLCTITGVVKKNQRLPDKSNLITVRSHSTQREYQILCPYFCPTRPNDVLTGYCTENNGQYRFVREPVVEPGASTEAIKTTFIIYLVKTR